MHPRTSNTVPEQDLRISLRGMSALPQDRFRVTLNFRVTLTFRVTLNGDSS